MSDEYRYDKLTWPEVNEAVEDEKMVLVPVGATEDHGHHLPLDVDRELVSAICERTARDRDPDPAAGSINIGNKRQIDPFIHQQHRQQHQHDAV